MALLAECGNAKEVVISVQESLERLVNALEYADDETNAYLRLERLMQLYIGGTSSAPTSFILLMISQLYRALSCGNDQPQIL